MTYAEKLKDPRWQRRRLEILNRDNWTCQLCLATKITLHVHHRRYISKTDPWNYPDELLETLCEDCHEFQTKVAESISDDLAEVGMHITLRDAAYLRAIAEQRDLALTFQIIRSLKGILQDPELRPQMEALYDRFFMKKTVKAAT